MARTGGSMVKASTGLRAQLPTLRRLAWTLIADILLGIVAIRVWQTDDPTAISNLIGVVFVLLVGAADISWEMLTEVSAELRP
jgi:tryptophan-rich sensory protein